MEHKQKTGRFLTALAGITILCAAASLCLGAVSISPGQLWDALMGRGNRTHMDILRLVRLPRTCGCLLAGTALAVSGAVIQGVLNNPLAAPNIIGVNAGAGFAVAVSCAISPAAVVFVPLAAFLGALAAAFLVLFISERAGAARITLVLTGVAISGIFSAGIDAVVTFIPDALNGYSDFRIGGMANLSMGRVIPAFWVILAVLPVILSLSNDLDILRLGTEQARSLGLNTRAKQLLFLALAAALAGAAVSFAGLLGFVGLIVPHVIRRLIGEESFPLLAGSGLGGAILLTGCDLLSRLLFAPYELPVGIVLSLAGGPFFIWLLLRQRGGNHRD